jgi:hypothetical protein
MYDDRGQCKPSKSKRLNPIKLGYTLGSRCQYLPITRLFPYWYKGRGIVIAITRYRYITRASLSVQEEERFGQRGLLFCIDKEPCTRALLSLITRPV